MARYYLDKSVDYGLTKDYQRVNLVHNTDYTYVDIIGKNPALLIEILVKQNDKFVKCLVPTHCIHIKYDEVDELKDGRFNSLNQFYYIHLLNKRLYQLKYPYKVSLIKEDRGHYFRMYLYIFIDDSKDGYLIEEEMIKLCIKLDKIIKSCTLVFIIRNDTEVDLSSCIYSYSPSWCNG